MRLAARKTIRKQNFIVLLTEICKCSKDFMQKHFLGFSKTFNLKLNFPQ